MCAHLKNLIDEQYDDMIIVLQYEKQVHSNFILSQQIRLDLLGISHTNITNAKTKYTYCTLHITQSLIHFRSTICQGWPKKVLKRSYFHWGP